MRKYILGYSDYEISIQLSLSRQGVTKASTYSKENTRTFTTLVKNI